MAERRGLFPEALDLVRTHRAVSVGKAQAELRAALVSGEVRAWEESRTIAPERWRDPDFWRRVVDGTFDAPPLLLADDGLLDVFSVRPGAKNKPGVFPIRISLDDLSAWLTSSARSPARPSTSIHPASEPPSNAASPPLSNASDGAASTPPEKPTGKAHSRPVPAIDQQREPGEDPEPAAAQPQHKPVHRRRQPQQDVVRGVLRTLYGDRIPSRAELADQAFIKEVSAQLPKGNLISGRTILRAASRIPSSDN